MKKLLKVLLFSVWIISLCSGGMTVMAKENSLSLTEVEQDEVPESPVWVEPLSDEDLDLMLYGARVVIPEGVKYYASADKQGSGAYGVIGNRYTPLGTDLYVGGFAQLDADGRLESYRGYNPKDVPVASHWSANTSKIAWDRIWVGIFLNPDDEGPIGWAPARSIVVLNGILGDGGSNALYKDGVKSRIEDDLETKIIDDVLPDPGNVIEDRVIREQDDLDDQTSFDGSAFISTRDIAYAIEDYADNGDKVALLLDGSGSVSQYMTDIADYGGYVDKVNKADVILAFAGTFERIAVEEYLDVDIDRGSTDVYSPINDLTDASSYDRIIIVTDTWHNVDPAIKLEKQDKFSGKIIVVCPDDEFNFIREDTIEEIESAFGTMVYLCRLNNELDRLRALETLKK